MKPILCLFLMLTLFMFGCALADENPIIGQIEVTPSVLPAAGDVKVSITISNSGNEDIKDPIALYSPQGKFVEDFAQGGYAMLNAGQSVTWNGTWSVSNTALEDGKLVCYIRYTTYSETGEAITQNMPLSATIRKGTAPVEGEGGLLVERVISPTVAQNGQEVTVKYLVTNNGSTPLYDITIQENKTIHKEEAALAELNSGVTGAITFTVKMGKKALTSSPKITYKTEKNGKTQTYNMEEATIAYGEPKLSASLESSAKSVVKNGVVTLSLMLKNTGTVAYSDIRVSDPVLGEIFSGESIDAGKTRELKKEVTVPETMNFCFTINATDETGTPLTLSTNELEVTAINEEDALKIDVQVTADRTEVYETPGRVHFKIVITNPGNVVAKDAVLTHGDVTIAKLGDINPGESKTLNRDTEITMSGRIRFTVKAKDSLGNTQTFAGNDIQIVISDATAAPATSTPIPEATAIPTAVIATVPPVSDSSIAPTAKFLHTITLPILILAAAIGISAVVLIIVAQKRRTNNAKLSDDSFELSSYRNYKEPSRNDTPEETVSQPNDYQTSDTDEPRYEPNEIDTTAVNTNGINSVDHFFTGTEASEPEQPTSPRRRRTHRDGE